MKKSMRHLQTDYRHYCAVLPSRLEEELRLFLTEAARERRERSVAERDELTARLREKYGEPPDTTSLMREERDRPNAHRRRERPGRRGVALVTVDQTFARRAGGRTELIRVLDQVRGSEVRPSARSRSRT